LAESVKQNFASRRLVITAMLPEDVVKAGALGLMSITVLPRQTVDFRWVLHFQWIWRTVEALVGFPYSAVASIQRSASILDQVNARLKLQGKTVAMGELVYLAQSFHLFDDLGDREIARTIVASALQ
jgi:hypothetical protein